MFKCPICCEVYSKEDARWCEKCDESVCIGCAVDGKELCSTCAEDTA